MIRAILLAASWFALASATEPGGARVTPVDPLSVQDDDFARHRNPAEWRGLSVTRAEFRDERASWRLWRIVDRAGPRGPLWVVPHDDEDGAFEAALAAVRKYGGMVVAVDSGVSGTDGTRRNAAVDYGRPIDPNRNFDTALPGYAARILAGRHSAAPVIALHTNAPGFNTARSRCNRSDTPGSGVISIRFCDETLTPRPSGARAWPWDDDDSVAFAAHRVNQSPSEAFCRDAMVRADFNVVQERVVTSDRSLSNYAVLHGIDYLNFETRDRGNSDAGLSEMRARLVAMVDRALALRAPAFARGKPSP